MNLSRLRAYLIDTGDTRNHVVSDSFYACLIVPDVSVEHWFERQIRPRYANPSDEKAFLISDIQEWINTLNIQDLDGPLEVFRRGLRI